MRNKKLLGVFALVAMSCLCSAVAVTASGEEANESEVPSQYVQVPTSWTYKESDESFTSTGPSWNGSFLLASTELLVGDYSLEADFTGSQNTEVTGEINMGIVPWYLDSANYVVAYMKWQPSSGFNMLDVQVMYYSNGAHGGWNDFWLDNAYRTTLYTLKPTDTIHMKVTKTLNADGTKDTYTVTISATNEGGVAMTETPATIEFSVSTPYAAQQAKAGYYVYNDTVTLKNMSIQSLTEKNVYKTVSGTTTTARSTSASGWTYADSKYTVDASEGTSLQNQAVLLNEYADKNYQVEYVGSVTGNATDKELSVSPWYKDENNYLNFLLKGSESGNTVTATGKLGGVEFSESPVTVGSVDWNSVKLTAKREGSYFSVLINDVEAASYINADILDGAKVALGGGKGALSVSSLSLKELQYVPYDWYSRDGWYMSAMSKDSIGLGENSIVLTSSAEETKYTAMYKASGKYNSVNVSANFTASAETASYGFYLYYVNENNYVSAVLSNSKITLTAVIEGTTNVYEEALTGVTLANANKLTATLEFADITVSLNDQKVLEKEVEALAAIDTTNVGLLAVGGAVTVTDFAIGGYTSYQAVVDGDWTLYGSRLNSWTVNEDGSVYGDNIGGQAFKSSRAIKAVDATPAEGYYMGAIVKITELSGNEYKTGLMPWYKDSQNYVYVWLSQWVNAQTMICVTAMIDGKVVGNEWRETAIAYTMLNADNYLEIKVEGDGLSIYLNKSFAPVVSTSIEGLSAQTAGYIGLNMFGTDVLFSSISVSNERIFTETGDATFETIGSMPTKGTIGTEVKLPVISATGAGGSTADVVVTVTNPDGEEVTLSGNKFTPDKEGTYKVTVKATDAWGNVTTQSYDIAVSADSGNTDNNSSNSGTQTQTGGCGSTIVTSFVSVAMLGFGAAMALRKKKED